MQPFSDFCAFGVIDVALGFFLAVDLAAIAYSTLFRLVGCGYVDLVRA